MMELIVWPDGNARCIYSEEIDLAALGEVDIVRASHVEPDKLGRWWADLYPIAGPRLGPFTLRSWALEAEMAWLRCHLLIPCIAQP